MPKNYGTYSDPLDVPRKKDVDAVASEVASKYSATNPPPYPVTSVNGSTGAITVNDIFWIKATIVSGGDNITADKTPLDVYNAIQDGKLPVMIVGNNMCLVGSAYRPNPTMSTITGVYFTGVQGVTSKGTSGAAHPVVMYVWGGYSAEASVNTWQGYTTTKIRPVPENGPSNVGQFLQSKYNETADLSYFAWASIAPESSAMLKGDGSGGITAAVAGTDYLKTAPVTSVNTKTGAVTLSASDVGAVNISGDVMEGGLYAATNAMIAYTDPQVRNECFLDESTFTGHEDAGDWETFFENKSQQICWKFE